MKRILIILLAFFALCSCHKEVDWFFSGESINFHVVDVEGNDLLDPSYRHNIITNGITVKHHGEEHYYGPSPRMSGMPGIYDARPLALRLDHWAHEPRNYISFGDFHPEQGWHHEEFIIDWGDGTSDMVVFDLYITWKKDKATVHRNLWVNGERQKNPFRVTLVKEPSSTGIRIIEPVRLKIPDSFQWDELEINKIYIFNDRDQMIPYLGYEYLDEKVDMSQYDLIVVNLLATGDRSSFGWERIVPQLYLYPDGQYVYQMNIHGTGAREKTAFMVEKLAEGAEPELDIQYRYKYPY